MKLLLFTLLHVGLARLHLPEEHQFQEYTESVQPALEFNEDDASAARFAWEITPDDGKFEVITLEKQAGKPLYGDLHIKSDVSLDRETTDTYSVTIKSVDASGNTINEKQTTIVVSDTNDNPPIINQDSLRMEINENASPGDEIGRVTATDADLEKFAELEFSIIDKVAIFYPRDGGSKDYSEAFDIAADGTVRLLNSYKKALLDAETYQYAEFSIMVIDDPQNSGAHSMAKGTVKVFIKDINDNAPEFSPNMATTGSVSESAEIGDAVDITISATDKDQDANNNKIGYKVLDPNSPFEFVGSVLVLKEKVDFEGKDQYFVRIKAYNPDSTNPGIGSEIVITINVTDANEPPVCEPFAQSQIPMENDVSLVGTAVGRLECSDGDSGNQVLKYQISDDADFFSIDERTGSVTLKSIADREWSAKMRPIEDYINNGMHTVAVTISDDGVPAMSATIPVQIKIGDQPDENPIFSDGPLSICGEPKFLSNVHFTIVDPDENGAIDGDPTVANMGFTVHRVAGSSTLWHLKYDGVLNTFIGQIDKLTITATDVEGGSEVKEMQLLICSCTAEGIVNDLAACKSGIGTPANEATFPLWIIILIVALVIGVLLIATIVIVKKYRHKEPYDPNNVGPDDDQIHLFSKDTDGAPAGNGIYDPNMTLINEKPGQKPHWAKPRPDGDLGDIINQCKDAADNEEIVPNALLEYNFEGTNSIISDLSSLASWTGQSEKDLELDALPDATQKFFRQHP